MIDKLKKILKTKKQWATTEILSEIKALKANKGVTFYHIGGYECLSDGTHKDATVVTLKDLQDFMDDYEIEYDAQKNFKELLLTAEKEWNEIWDDGGGRGWVA